jgi:chromosome segregation ATPase
MGMKGFLAGLGLAIAVGSAAVVHGQTGLRAATLDDVLTELQGLRADMTRLSSATVRVQVLTARLSLEEQRINDAGRELASARGRLSDTTAKLQAAQGSLKELETAVSTNSFPLERQRDVESILPSRRAEVAALQASEQTLRADVNMLAGIVADDQNRWTDFSSRLDELERSLPAGR